MVVEIDRLLLGTNPLTGVDHFDRARARVRMQQLDFDKVLRVIEASLTAGAQGMTFTVNPEMHAILTALKKRTLGRQIGLYPLLPDVQTFRRAISEGSMMGLARELLRGLGPIQTMKALFHAGLPLIETNPLSLFRLYTDIEFIRLKRLIPIEAEVKAILVHEIITDMAIALNAKTLMEDFVAHLSDDIGVIPGFATRNLRQFGKTWRDWGLSFDGILVMTPINKLGFQMTPSRDACEQTLKEMKGASIIAMSPLAAGRLSLTEGIKYLQSIVNVSSVAIGVSSEAHARETFSFLNQAMG